MQSRSERVVTMDTRSYIAYTQGFSIKAIEHVKKHYSNITSAGEFIELIYTLENEMNIYQDEAINEQLARLSLECDTLLMKQKCKKCWTNDLQILCLPCTHIATCKSCMTKICYICNEKVESIVYIYI